MAFKDLPGKPDFIQQEYEILKFWKETRSFEKLRELRRGKPKWSFLDGPITANNPMGVHHGWGRTYKDVYNRFWAMRDHELRYQNGFDCQGLWVEVEVEKELGFKSKKQIEAYGLDKFVLNCKERVLRYAAVQTEQSIRLGYWMDWNDPDLLCNLADKIIADPNQPVTIDGVEGPVSGTVEKVVGLLGQLHVGGSYFTFADENNYMIWLFLKKCWQNGWIYKGADVMPWCPRCATGISQHEIVTDGYADITHRSVVLLFPLRGRDHESLLIWTTTPWTLTSNVAAAVGSELLYAKVKQGEQIYYLSKDTLSMLSGDYQVLDVIQGKDMAGWTYDGPFDDLPAAKQAGGVTELTGLIQGIRLNASEVHQIILWDDVGKSEGTGIVHIAPGCGAEDFILGKEHGFPLLAPIDEEGFFVSKYDWLTGMHVSQVTTPIFDDLRRKGILYHVEPYTHRYPTCWRCKTELVFRLVDEWFINMGESYDKPREELTEDEKRKSLRYQIMDVVDQIQWIPDFGHARELDWLRNMQDWMISKKRYWGLALPIWVCDQCNHFEVIGSDEELEERAIKGWETFRSHSPHRPFIDAVKIACPKCNTNMNRIEDVGNPWLDAGIVSFSTMGYRKDREYWEKWFPADWVSESFPGQFRNWFYSLLVMSTVIAGTAPYHTLFGYASLHAEDGMEMHKSSGNMIEFNEAADKMGVDVMRWLFCAHKPENNLFFGYQRADAVRRQFLLPLWNVYSFFITYAKLDGWQPETSNFDPNTPEGTLPQSIQPLDTWILGRLNQVVERVTVNLENSDAFSATLAVESFLDDLTNWYIRRSRRRFWKSELDADKQGAYATLYHLLVKFVRVLAPFTPFIAEEIYQNLVRSIQPESFVSVHHTLFPGPQTKVIDETLMEQMEIARRIAGLGLSARSSAGIKLRQPLTKCVVNFADGNQELTPELTAIVSDELNVKTIEFTDQPGDLIRYQIQPENQLLGPKYGAQFPGIRRALGALDPNFVANTVNRGEMLTLELAGKTIELSPEEILVSIEAAVGYAVATDKQLTVGVDTKLTEELKAEGLAREIVRRVQAMRKNADFKIDDRITLYYEASEALANVFASWSEYIQAETLAVSLVPGEVPEHVYQETHKVDQSELKLGVER